MFLDPFVNAWQELVLLLDKVFLRDVNQVDNWLGSEEGMSI
jgi:hypothetical protein